MNQPQPQQQNVVQPSPTQETWIVDQVSSTDGKIWVRIQIASCTGVHVSHMPGEAAEQIGAQISAAGQRGKTGIILPPGLGLNGHTPH